MGHSPENWTQDGASFLMKKTKDDQCLAHYQWCLYSMYHNTDQKKLKHFPSFFSQAVCMVHEHISPCLFCLVDHMRADMK